MVPERSGRSTPDITNNPRSYLGSCSGIPSGAQNTPGNSTTRYGGNAGIYPAARSARPDRARAVDPNYSSILGQANGVINFGSSTRISAITDGTSNTFLMADGTSTCSSQDRPGGLVLLVLGAYSDTMFTTLYPVNPTGDPVRRILTE